MFEKKLRDWVRVLAVGDVVGRPGRRILGRALPVLRRAADLDAVVVNVENAAGGFGMTPEIYQELLGMGVDCMTSGNHIFDKNGTEAWIPEAERLLRPQNYPEGTPGNGFYLFQTSGGVTIGVMNFMARTFMKPYDCPFRCADKITSRLRTQTPILLVDFHGEATSEKQALGWYLAGRVSAVWGTHTHVPTADARIFAGHTGYLTDLGMTGPHDSVIGMEKEGVINGFLTLGRTRFEVAKDDPRIGACLFDIEIETGRCVRVQSLFLSAQDLEQISQSEANAGRP